MLWATVEGSNAFANTDVVMRADTRHNNGGYCVRDECDYSGGHG